jgi:hypothetical protein
MIYEDRGVICAMGNVVLIDPELAGLWQVNVYTGDRRRVLNHGHSPAISPNGRYVAFASGGIRVMDLESGDVHDIGGPPGSSDPSWSMDGTRLAWSQSFGAEDSGTWIASFDLETTPSPSRVFPRLFAPRWHPTDGLLLGDGWVDTETGDRAGLVLASLVDSTVTLLVESNERSFLRDVDCSHDGGWLAYTEYSLVGRLPKVVVSSLTDLREAIVIDAASQAAWTLDDAAIVFVREAAEESEAADVAGVLWSYDTVTGDVRQVAFPWPVDCEADAGKSVP